MSERSLRYLLLLCLCTVFMCLACQKFSPTDSTRHIDESSLSTPPSTPNIPNAKPIVSLEATVQSITEGERIIFSVKRDNRNKNCHLRYLIDDPLKDLADASTGNVSLTGEDLQIAISVNTNFTDGLQGNRDIVIQIALVDQSSCAIDQDHFHLPIQILDKTSSPSPTPSPTPVKGCEADEGLFMNPFSKESAHHRPLGTGAIYAGADHPATRGWLRSKSFNINVGAPFGVAMAQADQSGPLLVVRARPDAEDKIVGLPVTIRFPKGGFPVSNPSGRDGVAIIYDSTSGIPYQLREYSWNDGRPVAGQFKTWDMIGLGHGKSLGDRIGTSASGVAAAFGLLRGVEVNTPGKKIEHALQMVLPMKHTSAMMCNILLSREIQLPAVSRDRGAELPSNNTGHIAYGALLAIPPTVDIRKLDLSEPGMRLAEAIQKYGIYAVDAGGCTNGAIRADQFVSSTTLQKLKVDIPKFYPLIRLVVNSDYSKQQVSGGGAPIAPNCAFDSLDRRP